MMIDTHCHLDLNDENLKNKIEKMKDNIIIVSGYNTITNKEVLKLCEKYKNIYGTIGYHPDEVDGDINLDLLEENINNPKIVGVGEIGLDYYWHSDNKEKQKKLFIEQIELAKKNNKTIVVHSRDAAEDTYEILKKYNLKKVIMHCYSYSYEMALKFKELGVYFGIGGVVTFKNGKKLVEVVKNIDINKLLLETDSPYLSPEPFRGKENEPYNIIYVAEKIAEIKGISVEEVLKITTDNAICQFDLKLNL